MLARNFYVDDFLASAPTEEEALNIIEEGVSRLKRYDLKLCKVQSNAPLISAKYPPEDSPKTVTFKAQDNSPTESSDSSSSLGLQWTISSDDFSSNVMAPIVP